MDLESLGSWPSMPKNFPGTAWDTNSQMLYFDVHMYQLSSTLDGSNGWHLNCTMGFQKYNNWIIRPQIFCQTSFLVSIYLDSTTT